MPSTNAVRRAASPSLLALMLSLLSLIAFQAVPGSVAAAPVTTGGFTSDALAPVTIQAGTTASITARVTAASTERALVDLEVYAPNGQQVFQRFWDDRPLDAGRQGWFTATWAIPADARAGEYVVKIGVFGAGWAGLRHWNNSAVSFTVAGGTTTTTTTAPPITTPPAPAPPAAGGSQFVETFDGVPTVPTPFSSPRWNMVVHSRDTGPTVMDPMDAHHGPQCQAPMDTHSIVNRVDAVFTCNNHMMTAVHGRAYAAAYLTPNRRVDFRSGTAVVQWDVSTLPESGRDWWDVWILPNDMVLPGDASIPDDAFAVPDRAVQIRLNSWERGRTGIEVYVYRNGQPEFVNREEYYGLEHWLASSGGLSASRRETMRLEISQGHLRFGLPGVVWFADTDIAPLDWSVGTVKLGHHSYTPDKDGDRIDNPRAGTWHWDNVIISPAI